MGFKAQFKGQKSKNDENWANFRKNIAPFYQIIE